MKSALSHSEKQPDVKRKSTSTKSKTNWTRLESKHSDVKPTAEHPDASLRHIVRGIVRRGLEPLPTKSSISLRLDRDVLEWFKAQGPGYQTKINTVLRAFRDASV
ncbi:MAG: BrnA antitoxin family protein [Proteobacteria bacterium]|nr:BrnA antitoxin family protein [Pseudomonadota bacterium]